MTKTMKQTGEIGGKADQTQHTPEPWYRDDLLPPNGRPVIARTVGRIPISATTDDWLGWDGEDEANARRICAAVNACQGISTQALENGIVKKLIVAAIHFDKALSENHSDGQLCKQQWDALRAVIAEATGNHPSWPTYPIIIEVRGGVVQNVLNLPPGCEYEIKDYDNIEADEEVAARRPHDRAD